LLEISGCWTLLVLLGGIYTLRRSYIGDVRRTFRCALGKKEERDECVGFVTLFIRACNICKDCIFI